MNSTAGRGSGKGIAFDEDTPRPPISMLTATTLQRELKGNLSAQVQIVLK